MIPQGFLLRATATPEAAYPLIAAGLAQLQAIPLHEAAAAKLPQLKVEMLQARRVYLMAFAIHQESVIAVVLRLPLH